MRIAYWVQCFQYFMSLIYLIVMNVMYWKLAMMMKPYYNVIGNYTLYLWFSAMLGWSMGGGFNDWLSNNHSQSHTWNNNSQDSVLSNILSLVILWHTNRHGSNWIKQLVIKVFMEYWLFINLRYGSILTINIAFGHILNLIPIICEMLVQFLTVCYWQTGRWKIIEGDLAERLTITHTLYRVGFHILCY